MHAKIVWAVAAVWLVLFLASFVVLQVTPPTGDGFTRGLNRIASFMTWQGAAFGLAMVGALLTYRFGGAGGKYGKLVGYVPLSFERIPDRHARRDDRVSGARAAAVQLAGSSRAITPQPVTAGSV